MHFRTIFASFFLATAVVAAPFGLPSGSNPLSPLSDEINKVTEIVGSGNQGNGNAGNGNEGNGNAGNGNKDNGTGNTAGTLCSLLHVLVDIS